MSNLVNLKLTCFPQHPSCTNLELSPLATEEPRRSNHKVLKHSFKDNFLFPESSEESESFTESEDDDDGWFCAKCQKVTPSGSKRKELDDWIQCDFCDNWFHSYCEQIPDDYVNK